jgi:pseudouridylate synthase / pseudouridine kinase
MILAHLAGIKVFATGGLGGVHQGGQDSFDISADLTELGRTPVAVISAGCKSFLDLPRTLEYLETQGVGVATFADGREGPVDLPAFYVRDSGIQSPRIVKDEKEAAAIIFAQSRLPIQSGLWFAGPVPAQDSLSKEEVDAWVKLAVCEAESKGIYGAANTPYILDKIKQLSGGRSVAANKAGISANVIRGAKVALELAKLELHEGDNREQ